MPERAKSLPLQDVCIVGGGPVGLTLALALSQAGLSCAIVSMDAPERAKALRNDARAYSIANGCWRIWRALGVADDMIGHAQPVERVTAEGGGAHPAIFGMDDLGDGDEPLSYMVEAGHIDRALSAAVEKASGVSLIAPAEVTNLVDEGVVLSDGRTLPARIVVGCDGKDSRIRKLADIGQLRVDYDAHAFAMIARIDLPHMATAKQSFLRDGPIALLPLPDNRANLIWFVPSKIAATLSALSDDDFAAELAHRAGGFFGSFELLSRPVSYPLRLQVADRFCAGHVALAGDSAHVVHPLAGQGLNLGLKDAAALAECLADAARVGLDLRESSALETYEKWRRADVVQTALAMDGFHRVFRSSGPLPALTGLGMSLSSLSPTLRKAFTLEAGGQSGDPPRLMQGLALSPG